MLENTPPRLPIGFVRDGLPVTEFVKVDPAKRLPRFDAQYHPTAIIGACTVCKTAGSLDFPNGFDFKTGDRIMDGRVVRVFCIVCRRVTEFRPLNPTELGDEKFAILRRHYDVYKRLVVEGKPIPADMAEFIRLYEERLKPGKTAEGPGAAAAPEGPAKPEGGEPPRIVVA